MNENFATVEPQRNLSTRTKSFALRIIRVYAALPHTTSAQVLGKQLLRSGTSVGAHYREACRARSPAEFVSKLEVGLQELEETKYWLELLIDAEVIGENRLNDLLDEAEQLTAMLAASVNTTKAKRHSTPR